MVFKTGDTMNIFCKIFGHKTIKDNSEDGWLTGAIHCTRKGCDYIRLALNWPKPPIPTISRKLTRQEKEDSEWIKLKQKGDKMGKKESNPDPPVKKVTKKRLIEIFEIWKECQNQSFEEIKKGWASPDYSKDCADYVWSKL